VRDVKLQASGRESSGEKLNFKIKNDCSQWIIMESMDSEHVTPLMDETPLQIQLIFNLMFTE
jgi:hypothetical protein